MKHRDVRTEDLRPGMRLYGWTHEANKRYGLFAALHDGPDGGPFEGMVVSNVVTVPGKPGAGVGGDFTYPPVHTVTALFWNEAGHSRLHSFHWTAGTTTEVIE